MSVMKSSVKATSKSNAKTVVDARGFKIIIDEPQALGGTNEGPNPVEFVLGALAGCLNVVGNMVAQEMGFSFDSLEFKIEGDLDPAKFSGTSDTGRAGFMEIRASVIVKTDADDETLKQWIAAVEERCPVSDNLANTTPVKISIDTV